MVGYMATWMWISRRRAGHDGPMVDPSLHWRFMVYLVSEPSVLSRQQCLHLSGGPRNALRGQCLFGCVARVSQHLRIDTAASVNFNLAPRTTLCAAVAAMLPSTRPRAEDLSMPSN